SPVAVLSARCTRNGPTGNMRIKAFACCDPTCPPLALGIETHLIRLGSIYALQPHMSGANSNGIPVMTRAGPVRSPATSTVMRRARIPVIEQTIMAVRGSLPDLLLRGHSRDRVKRDMNRVRCQFRRGENGPLVRAHRYGLGLIPRERKGYRKLW